MSSITLPSIVEFSRIVMNSRKWTQTCIQLCKSRETRINSQLSHVQHHYGVNISNFHFFLITNFHFGCTDLVAMSIIIFFNAVIQVWLLYLVSQCLFGFDALLEGDISWDEAPSIWRFSSSCNQHFTFFNIKNTSISILVFWCHCFFSSNTQLVVADGLTVLRQVLLEVSPC